MMKEKRIACLDNARALSMLYIVGFWHLQEYMSIQYFTPILYAVTEGVLATFAFISGYLAGQREIKGWKDVISICKKRLFRIYPLFFISCTTLYMIHLYWGKDYILDLEQYIKTILGISFVMTPAPSTVWYINMLFIFDIIALAVVFLKEFWHKILICVGFWGGLFLINSMYDGMDKRIFLYYPIYSIGLLAAGKRVINEKLNFKIMLFGGICFSFMCLREQYFLKLVSLLAFLMVMLQIGKMFGEKWSRILYYISLSSMCAYLFHRQIFYTLYEFVGEFTIAFAYLIALPITVIGSYYLQNGYNKIYNGLIHRTS